MKTPRIDDFQPNAPKLKSSLEHMPVIERSQQGRTATLEREQPAEKETPDERTPVRANERTGGMRTIKRHAFEFYQDQLETLKRISLRDQMEGGKGSQSAMVREALDEYIAKRAGK